MRYKYLTRKDLVEIHNKLLKKFGGPSDILSEAKLELCVGTPQRVVFGSEIYSTLHEKAACLIYEIIKLHPFLDGNKRTGYTAADVFLRKNGYEITASSNEGVDISLKVSSCLLEIPQMTEWIERHIRRLR